MTKKVQEGKPVTFTINASVLERIKAEARHKSAAENRDCHYSDLLRDAIDRLYAVPAENAVPAQAVVTDN